MDNYGFNYLVIRHYIMARALLEMKPCPLEVRMHLLEISRMTTRQ